MLQQNYFLGDGLRVFKKVVFLYLLNGGLIIAHTLNIDEMEEV